MKTIETTVYEFAELSDAAKEKAREWWRDGYDFRDDADYTIEDWTAIVSKLGLNVDQTYYSGFWSQGDGASFTGDWYATGVDLAALEAEYPRTPGNEWIHNLAATAVRIAEEYSGLRVLVTRSGNYCHEYTMDFDAEWADGDYDRELPDMGRDGEVAVMLRDMARALYRQLKAACEWAQADEQVDENIHANGYTFTETGERFR